MSGPTADPGPAMYALPALAPFLGNGFRDPLGKVAWRKEDAPTVAALLAENGFAITQVELWCLCWDDTYCNVVPFSDDKAGVVQWRLDTGWNPEAERWGAFCARCLDAALPCLTDSAYEQSLTREYGPDKMRLYIASSSESEYWS